MLFSDTSQGNVKYNRQFHRFFLGQEGPTETDSRSLVDSVRISDYIRPVTSLEFRLRLCKRYLQTISDVDNPDRHRNMTF